MPEQINLPAQNGIALPDALPAPAAPPAPTEPQHMVAPDGKIYTVPATSFNIAVKNGWKVATQADTDNRAQDKYLEENSIKEGIARFGNEATFGIPQYIYEKEHPEEAARWAPAVERYEEKHPVETGAEKAAGFVAPLLIPGVGEAGDLARAGVEGPKAAEGLMNVARIADAGEIAGQGVKAAAETTLSRKIAGSAAKYATEGAIYSAPQAMVQAAYGDPEQAAETMLWGAGINGMLGGVGRLAGEGLGSLAGEGREFLSSKLLDKQANGITYLDDISRNILNITDKEAKKLGPTQLTKIVQTADKEGWLSASPSKRGAAIKATLEDSGSKIGEHLDNLEERLASSDVKVPTPMDVAQEFNQQVQLKFPELFTDLHKSTLKVAADIETAMTEGGSDPSIRKLQELREIVGKKTKDFMKDSPSAEITRLADSVIKKNIEIGAQMLYHDGEAPERFADYLNQKQRSWAALQLIKKDNAFKGTGQLPFGGLNKLGLTDIFLAVHSLPLAAGRVGWRSFLRNDGGLLGKSVSYLRKAANDPAGQTIIGGLMAKEGTQALQAHLDRIPSILDKSQLISGTIAALNPFQHAMGEAGTGLSKEQQYNKLTASITQSAANQDLAAQKAGQIASSFTASNLQLGSLVATKNLAALNYLQSQIPKAPAPKPFGGKSDWKPSEKEKADFLRKVSIVNDPMSVWHSYQKGTLTPLDRDTLKAVYPAIYKEMVNKILQAAYDPNVKVPHAQRIQLSMFTGVPLDSSLQNLSAIQQAVAPGVPPQQPPVGSRRAGRHPKLNNIGSLVMTNTQRLANKGE